MKKVIITGATGFLGSSLVRKLTEKGVEVVAVVRDQKSNIDQLQQYSNVRIVFCPLHEICRLPSAIPDKDIDAFYHFAWAGTSGDTRADVELQLGNVKASCDAVRAASEIGCKRFINAGSIMEYEAMQYISSDETRPGLGTIYSTAKLTADFMAKTLASDLNLPYITCIISNIYGEGERSARFVNTTIRRFLKNEKTSFTDGKQLYDFIHISDAVRAFYLIGESGRPFTSYYIGNPIPQPLKNFIISIRDLVDKGIELKFGEIPFQGARLRYDEFDTYKLYHEFGFINEVSFEAGIKNTIQWIRNNECDNKGEK